MADTSQTRSGRTAKDVFTQAMQRDNFVKQEQEKAHANAAAKIARLRALRLAREAAEQEIAKADLAATPPGAAPGRKPRKVPAKAKSRS